MDATNTRRCDDAEKYEHHAEVLDDLLAVVEPRHLERWVGKWSALARFIETPAIVEAAASHMSNVPKGAGFGSFEELSSRRDATGVVRLR